MMNCILDNNKKNVEVSIFRNFRLLCNVYVHTLSLEEVPYNSGPYAFPQEEDMQN